MSHEPTYFCPSSPLSYISLVAGGAVAQVDPASTGLNPAWRTALMHVVAGESWPQGSSSAYINDVRGQLKNILGELEALAPGAGAYFNEVSGAPLYTTRLLTSCLLQASLYEKHPKETFFGVHYARLKAIKNFYDPQGVFVVAEGVGSEDWDFSLNCHL